MPHGILIIEDETVLAKNIGRYLERYDYEIRLAGSCEEGLRQFAAFNPDLVLLDYQLPGRDGLSALREIMAHDPHAKVILMTAHGSVEIAVEAMKAGASDYINKPLVLKELKILVDRALGQERLEGTLTYYQSRQASRGGLDSLIGESTAMETLRGQVRRIVNAESVLTDESPPAVLITGETGTGKELVARALHFEGARRDRPFVELNCSAVPEQLLESELFGFERGAFTDAKAHKMGLAEAAHGGTLFLDEIGDINQGMQVKLLKLLEDKTVRRLGAVRDRRVNIRIVAATNRNLEERISEGAFRSDLYFRLRTVSLSLPPLRERGSDILLLARHFLAVHGRRYRRDGLRFSGRAEASLAAHAWPGNVRELRNVIEQAVLLASGPLIDSDQLSLTPGAMAGAGGERACDNGRPWHLPEGGLDLDALERDLVVQALDRASWNVTRAARLLGLTRDTLRYRIEKFALSRPG